MTKREAIRAIKKYLEGDRKPNITNDSVLYWWRICNIAFFDRQLVKPKRIDVRKCLGKYGHCEQIGINQRNVEIVIANWIDTRDEFIGTLVHEMVHQWQYHHHGFANHGQTFLCWMPIFEKYNFPFDVTGP